MRKHIYTISLVVLLFACGFISLMYAITAEPNVNYYGCNDGNQIESTTQIDTDGDGKYDTYIVKWCTGAVKTYPVQYGFKGLDIDDLEDEIGPRPWEKPIDKSKKKPKIVYANPTSAFKEVVYDIETGVVDFWWELGEGTNYVALGVPETNPRISLNDGSGNLAANIALLPDPNSKNVKINFSVSESNRVSINVYNQNGISVATLYDGQKGKGEHEVNLNTSSLSNGLYFIQSRIGGSVFTQKLLLSK